ncbi:TPA: hypothetical protein ACGSIZ_004984 [Escherichia coli]|uniref:hypothetical protein n=1 Tax=Escherichia albertii TaxID=208962 RepID=UPI00235E8E21|nr:hypothetical protein [Escherichia albertii]WDC23232.1 hypothetical protein PS041_26645 [Escherichia albertii]
MPYNVHRSSNTNNVRALQNNFQHTENSGRLGKRSIKTAPPYKEAINNKWSIDDSKCEIDKSFTLPTPQKTYEEWKNEINNNGTHPRDAARHLGRGTNYEKLQGDVHSIRLSREHRVVFLVSQESHIVTVLRRGGHYK